MNGLCFTKNLQLKKWNIDKNIINTKFIVFMDIRVKSLLKLSKRRKVCQMMVRTNVAGCLKSFLNNFVSIIKVFSIHMLLTWENTHFIYPSNIVMQEYSLRKSMCGDS